MAINAVSIMDFAPCLSLQYSALAPDIDTIDIISTLLSTTAPQTISFGFVNKAFDLMLVLVNLNLENSRQFLKYEIHDYFTRSFVIRNNIL